MSVPSSAIESVLIENRVFPPSDATVKAARISGVAAYDALCGEAERDYEGFWAKLARENVTWSKPFTRTLDESNAPFYKWFEDGELNASANCLDKHMGTPVEQSASRRAISRKSWAARPTSQGMALYAARARRPTARTVATSASRAASTTC